jgi:hypothetical protein
VDAVEQEKLTKQELVKKAYIEKGVKPRTTKRYIRDLIDCGVIDTSNEGKLFMKTEVVDPSV